MRSLVVLCLLQRSARACHIRPQNYKFEKLNAALPRRHARPYHIMFSLLFTILSKYISGREHDSLVGVLISSSCIKQYDLDCK